MTNCDNCGYGIEDEWAFCINCGQRTAREIRQIKVNRRARTSRPIRASDSRSNEPGHDGEFTRILSEVLESQADVAKLVKKLTVGQDRVKPTRRIWAIAIFAFAISIVMIGLSTARAIQLSSLNSQAMTLHDQAQAERSQILSEIVSSLTTGAGSENGQFTHSPDADGLIPSLLFATNQINQADALDLRADSIGTVGPFEIYFIAITLAVGSAILGGVISWALPQFLVNRRRREPSANRIAQA